MSAEPTTPRRSSRIVQKGLTVRPVRSFKRGYTWKWPDEPLASSEVDVPAEDADDALHFYSGIYRQDPSAASSSSNQAASSAKQATKRKGRGRPKASSNVSNNNDGEAFRIGDTILVNTRKGSYPSVGVILSLWQPKPSEGSDSVPRIRVQWFVQPSELPKVRADREHAPNEIYYSLNSTAIISPQDILAHCSVSNDPKDALDSEEDQPNDEHKFCCFYAIRAEKGVYYNFNWGFHREQALLASDGVIARPSAWKLRPRDEDIDETMTSPSKKRASPTKRKRPDDGDSDAASESSTEHSGDEFSLEAASSDSESDDDHGVDSDESSMSNRTPHTPRKRRRIGTTHSPSKRDDFDMENTRIFQTPSKPKQPSRAASVAPTPHSKAGLRARQRLKSRRNSTGHKLAAPEFSVTDTKALSRLPKDAHLRAMHVLHVGSRPDALPCRDEEFNDVLEKVLVLLEDGAGGCVYISGVPGTGKTATVHAVVRELHAMAKKNEINPFSYVEINGLKIPDASAAYGVLWESISGHDVAAEGHLRVSSKEALRKLDKHFSSSGAAGPGSHACIVLMDELDQLVTAKQDVVYNFFNWPTLPNSKLIVLAVANTMDLPERAMSGKVRSRLGMFRVDFRPYKREQLEAIVHSRLKTATDSLSGGGDVAIMDNDAVRLAAARVAGVSGDARRVLDVCRRAVELHQSRKRSGPVKTKDISEVMAEMQNSPTAAYIRDCSFHERIMLAALWKCLKRSGLSVVKWDDVAYQHSNLLAVLPQDLDSQRRPSYGELLIVLDSLTATRAILIEDVRRGVADGERKMMLNLEEAEVLRVLGETGGPKWRSFLGI
ncbi:P-loop containing nucleoside triphosphate hydrolase protein [Clavulina sp. PMI_390]|nr:P-loop containing nucleoside triphosphate hydrolase protein [Clavulina sp. PMI_390]